MFLQVEDYTTLEILFERGALSTASPQSLSSSNEYSMQKGTNLTIDFSHANGKVHSRKGYDISPKTTKLTVKKTIKDVRKKLTPLFTKISSFNPFLYPFVLADTL